MPTHASALYARYPVVSRQSGCAVSRAFGDRLLKRFVVADPDILEAELGAEDRVLILATDGLWDVISNEEAIRLIRVRADAGSCVQPSAQAWLQGPSTYEIACCTMKICI